MAELEKFKLSSLSWDGDKNEEDFFIFLENFGSMVRSTKDGYDLEDMLDSKLRRARVSSPSPSAPDRPLLVVQLPRTNRCCWVLQGAPDRVSGDGLLHNHSRRKLVAIVL